MKIPLQHEINIRQHLEKVLNIDLPDRYEALQLWQSRRLMKTHSSLYDKANFRPAMDFFRDDLYGALNFRRRNKQLIRALPIMCRTLPESMLSIVEKAAELHVLSLELDIELLSFIPNQLNIDELSTAQWIAAYQQCDNVFERRHQIALVEDIGQELSTIVLKPAIGRLLKWAALPAKVTGFSEIHQFVCDGYFAFLDLKNPKDFLNPVVETERKLSVHWFNGEDIIRV